MPSAMTIALGKENFKKINKKHLLPSAGAVALGKEVKKTDFFAECRSCGTRQRVKKN